MRHVGFTGTRQGMTEGQKLNLGKLLQSLKWEVLHHGDCMGADEQSHEIAKISGYRRFIHPPYNDFKRAYCSLETGDSIFEPAGYHQRNMDIVHKSQLLIGAPKELNEIVRSGTWSTIRYAKRNRKSVIILFPDGRIDQNSSFLSLT